jgi:hypothetical protein
MKKAYRSVATAFSIPANTLASPALRVVGRLEQVRHYTRDDHGFARNLGTVISQVAFDLACSHGDADQNKIALIELGDQLVKVLCERVVVVACGWLAGLAEASSVLGDDPITSLQQDG